jgi:tryptophan-rich sensory protein
LFMCGIFWWVISFFSCGLCFLSTCYIASFNNPPDWVFGPVWTILYFVMTISIWLYWHTKNREMNTIYIYFIHLVFNATWSITFFAFHNMILALVVLIILIALIINLILSFRRVKMISAYLMIPYLLWCCFALILNISLIILN